MSALAYLLATFSVVSAQNYVEYQNPESRWLIEKVNDAVSHVTLRGEAAFSEFRVEGGPFRNKDFYIFVLDRKGVMRVHPDPSLEGQQTMELKDVHGKPIIRGLLDTVFYSPEQTKGWFHYEWPVPNGILPRWKSTYLEKVRLPSGEEVAIGAGIYSDEMERAFVVQMVEEASREMGLGGKAAFARFRDPTDRFFAKDSYIFVIDESGVDLVNPGFPTLEGRNLLRMKDARGKYFVQELLKLAKTRGQGFVEYDWPRPLDNLPTRKSSYVKKVSLNGRWVVVGSGAYLPRAEVLTAVTPLMNSEDVVQLVRAAATKLAKEGPSAYPAFREKPSRWFHDNIYLFVWNLAGVRLFHAANPGSEGENASNLKDIQGRPVGQFILEATDNASGEGWAHYLYPEPQNLFPIWKSTFVKKVTFPDGQTYLLGCGVYQLAMDKMLVEDLVERASALIEKNGTAAFAQLRDRKGPYFFMDTYVFVDTPDGVERLNPAMPTLEGRNLLNLTDAMGKPVQKEILHAAKDPEGGWVTYEWYKPSHTGLHKKYTFVKTVRSPEGTFIVGAGFYEP